MCEKLSPIPQTHIMYCVYVPCVPDPDPDPNPNPNLTLVLAPANLALHKPVSASTVHEIYGKAASVVTDGAINHDSMAPSHAGFMCSYFEESPWVEIDLGSSQSVAVTRMIMRHSPSRSSITFRSSGFTVTVDSTIYVENQIVLTANTLGALTTDTILYPLPSTLYPQPLGSTVYIKIHPPCDALVCCVLTDTSISCCSWRTNSCANSRYAFTRTSLHVALGMNVEYQSCICMQCTVTSHPCLLAGRYLQPEPMLDVTCLD